MACSGRLQRGGEPAALTTPDTKQDEFAHWWPEVLPGGHAVLFTVVKGVGIQNMEIAVLDLRTGERRTLLPGGSVRRGGQSRRGAESGVGGPRRPGGGARHASTRLHLSPRISPDGTRLALNLRDEENDIWLWDFAREMLTRLTFDPGQDRFPLWSPDGRRIAFSSQRDKSRGNPFWQAADGTGTVERLAEMSGRQVFPTSFSPDGTQLLVYGDAAGNPDDDDVSVVQTQGEPRRPTAGGS